MKFKVETVSISKVKANPANPRVIKNDKYKSLVKSLREFPEMLELREIVVDETLTVLGGNMRLKALQEIGEKQVVIKIVEGLTEAQKKEFVIKDNAGFGEWDFDALANQWSDLPLADWGVDGLEELTGDTREKLEEKEYEIRPYKKVHILISINIDNIGNVGSLIDELRQTEGVEIEQSAN